MYLFYAFFVVMGFFVWWRAARLTQPSTTGASSESVEATA
jgi:hypothetical protein